jgi:hypothetical protein
VRGCDSISELGCSSTFNVEIDHGIHTPFFQRLSLLGLLSDMTYFVLLNSFPGRRFSPVAFQVEEFKIWVEINQAGSRFLRFLS